MPTPPPTAPSAIPSGPPDELALDPPSETVPPLAEPPDPPEEDDASSPASAIDSVLPELEQLGPAKARATAAAASGEASHPRAPMAARLTNGDLLPQGKNGIPCVQAQGSGIERLRESLAVEEQTFIMLRVNRKLDWKDIMSGDAAALQ